MRRSGSVNVCALLLASVLLIAVLSLISISIACASSYITPRNSVTEDASDKFSVDICMDESKEVEFGVSSGLIYEWTWSVNEEAIKESEGESSNLSYVFEDYGIYNVCVVGEGETVQTCWNVTVSLVIGEENDVRELDGLEDYAFQISKRPERIISMAPSCTEILFAVGAGDSVVGVTEYCNYPPEVEEKKEKGEIEEIGGYSTPSLEKIVNLEPDLIVSAYGNPSELLYWLVDKEEHPGIEYPVYAQNPKNIEDIFSHIKTTAAITRRGDNAISLLNSLEERMKRITEKVKSLEEEQRPNVFYTCGDFWTPGNDTFINDVISAAGGKSTAAGYGSGYFQIRPDNLVEENPQVIICPSENAREQILNDEQLRELNGVKYGRIHVINDNVICRPGPRIVDAVETVYGYLSALLEPAKTYPMLQYNAQRTGNVPGKGPVTSNLLWQSPNETHGCIQAGPVIHDGKVYVETWYSGMGGADPDETNALFCLDEDTGEILWMNKGVYGASTAAIADGKLFVGARNGNITCVNGTDGGILWSKKIEESPAWYGVASSPLVFNELVYILSFSDGTLHTFSFDGTELWNYSTGGEIFCYSSPSAYGNKIFFAGNSGEHALHCVDLNTREEVWNFTTKTEIRGSPTIWSEEGMVFFTTKYIPTKKYGIYAVNITTGEEIWHKKHKSSWASPALSNGKLFIGGSSADTTFYCYDAKKGALIWKNEDMEGAIQSSPVVVGGKVYLGTSEVDGKVYALDANSGSIIWNYTLYTPPGFGGGYNVASHPAISNRTLFIGVDNIGVLAFRDLSTICDTTAPENPYYSISGIHRRNITPSHDVYATRLK
ncbi:Cobalamin-binding protein [ANME-1 cluster archaeon GoMg1]|nr:Cobalamin-binding protein [ANME-1 cluster archaeon GoMg1]